MSDGVGMAATAAEVVADDGNGCAVTVEAAAGYMDCVAAPEGAGQPGPTRRTVSAFCSSKLCRMPSSVSASTNTCSRVGDSMSDAGSDLLCSDEIKNEAENGVTKSACLRQACSLSAESSVGRCPFKRLCQTCQT